MTTGPQHYAEAERLIAEITHAGALLPGNRVLNIGDHSQVLQLIQAHATLALAAATALGQREITDHDGAPPCPVHEPGDVVPAEQRQENDR